MHLLFSLLCSLLLIAPAPVASLPADQPTANDCSYFRTGKFTFKEAPQAIVDRDNQFQTERVPATGWFIKMSITWTSDCTYELRLVDTNSRKTRRQWKKAKVMKVVITSVDGDSYTYSATTGLSPTPVTGTMIKK